jgi:hypothetical protein
MIKTFTKTIHLNGSAPSSTRLCKVTAAKDWQHFFHLPHTIYKDDKQWVPPLRSEQQKLFSQKKPFFLKARFCAWLVFDEGKPTGRIVAYVDNAYNEFHQTKNGFFGFFECLADSRVAAILLQAAQSWLANEGMARMIGPINFDTGNECGVLLKGSRFPPYLQMAHTPLYYRKFLEDEAFVKEHDLLAFRINLHQVAAEKELMNRLANIAKRTGENASCTIRCFAKNNFDKEMAHVHYAYNNWMKDNWGFSPVSEMEMKFAAASLKSIVDPDLVLFAQQEKELIGCCISLPDVNQVLQKMNGSIFPFGFLQYLYYRKKINRVRLMLLAVSPAHRNKGLDVFFCYHSILKAIELGYKEAELSWVSEDNTGLITILKKFNAELYKQYRVFAKDI